MPFVSKAERNDPRPNPIPLTPEEREIQRLLRTANANLEIAAGTEAVRNAIASNNIERVVDAFPWDETALTINEAATTLGQVVRDNIGGGFPSASLRGRFDYTDPRSIRYAQAQAAQLVTAVTESTREMIRNTIARSFNENITVSETARNLRGLIGLNDRQVITYDKFRRSVDAQIFANEITSAQGNKMLKKRYDKLIKDRAELIARQEIIMAENAGRHLGFQQSIEQGWSSPKAMKRWSSSTDERTCDICGPMNGKSVQWDKAYPNGVFNPPAHILCRCTISLLEPDSSLAQSFMEPAPIAPPTKNIPLPELPTVAVGNLRTPLNAINDASKNTSGLSTFQYDAGEIEGLDVALEEVIYDGVPSTEIRFKLVDDAKKRLRTDIQRQINAGIPTFKRTSSTLVIDKKVDKRLLFRTPPDGQNQQLDLRRRIVTGADQNFAYADFDFDSDTYDRLLPNGTRIRFVTSKNTGFSYDGLVRVVIPGKATPEQISEVMKELGIKANRLPSAEDLALLKENRIISLFSPDFGNPMLKTPAERAEQIRFITSKRGFKMDDVISEIDADGALRFRLPDEVAARILTDARVQSFEHNLGSFLSGKAQGDKTAIIVNLFTDNPKLLANTQRKVRGVKGTGMSEATDVETGGADYVFLRPRTEPVTFNSNYSGNMVFNPQPLTARGDWFAYSEDSYGVKNPAKVMRLNTKKPTTWSTTLQDIDYLEELTDPSGHAEIMFPGSVELKDLYSMTLDPITRDEALTVLRGRGITEWYGRPIEEVIVLPGNP